MTVFIKEISILYAVPDALFQQNELYTKLTIISKHITAALRRSSTAVYHFMWDEFNCIDLNFLGIVSQLCHSIC